MVRQHRQEVQARVLSSLDVGRASYINPRHFSKLFQRKGFGVGLIDWEEGPAKLYRFLFLYVSIILASDYQSLDNTILA